MFHALILFSEKIKHKKENKLKKNRWGPFVQNVEIESFGLIFSLK